MQLLFIYTLVICVLCTETVIVNRNKIIGWKILYSRSWDGFQDKQFMLWSFYSSPAPSLHKGLVTQDNFYNKPVSGSLQQTIYVGLLIKVKIFLGFQANLFYFNCNLLSKKKNFNAKQMHVWILSIMSRVLGKITQASAPTLHVKPILGMVRLGWLTRGKLLIEKLIKLF